MMQPSRVTPRAVGHARRSAGAGACTERLLESKIAHRPRQDQHFFEVLVYDRAGIRGSGPGSQRTIRVSSPLFGLARGPFELPDATSRDSTERSRCHGTRARFFPGTPFHQISIQTPGRVPVSPANRRGGSRRAAVRCPVWPHRVPGDRRDRGLPAHLLLRQPGQLLPVVSAVAATALWPLLVLLGADLHVSLPNL